MAINLRQREQVNLETFRLRNIERLQHLSLTDAEPSKVELVGKKYVAKSILIEMTAFTDPYVLEALEPIKAEVESLIKNIEKEEGCFSYITNFLIGAWLANKNGSSDEHGYRPDLY